MKEIMSAIASFFEGHALSPCPKEGWDWKRKNPTPAETIDFFARSNNAREQWWGFNEGFVNEAGPELKKGMQVLQGNQAGIGVRISYILKDPPSPERNRAFGPGCIVINGPLGTKMVERFLTLARKDPVHSGLWCSLEEAAAQGGIDPKGIKALLESYQTTIGASHPMAQATLTNTLLCTLPHSGEAGSLQTPTWMKGQGSGGGAEGDVPSEASNQEVPF